MIGSKAKTKAIFSHLLANGIAKGLLDRVHAPIGLEIHAQTPEEIAVSILAEIVTVRRSA
jgi:xanthine dehydrogenase accessory factor